MKKHELNSDNHLSIQQMQAYLTNELSDTEMHYIEKHLLECSFCAEAMEGLELMEDISLFEEDVLRLEKRIRQRTQKKDRDKPLVFYKKILAIAAMVTLLVGASFLIHNYLKTTTVQKKLAEKTEKELPVSKKLAEMPQEDKTAPATEMKLNEFENQVAETTKASNLENKNRQPEAVLEEAETEETFYLADDVVVEEIVIEKDDEILDETATIAEVNEDNETLIEPTAIEDDKVLFAEMEQEILELSLEAGNGRQSKSARRAKHMPARIDLPDNTAPDIRKITGTVFSSDGYPLPFATINLKDKETGTTTDENGEFTLSIPEETQTLVVTYVGMETGEIEISERDTVIITLEDSWLAMDEVVVLVPGIKRKSGSNKTAYMYYTSTKPKPKIGTEQYKTYLKDSLRYPHEARNAKIKGKVILRLHIGMNGEIKQVSVVKGLGYGCDEEAIRLVKNGSGWLPGRENGRLVEMDVEVKVRFK